MKIIAIGDIHGRTNWEAIVEKEKDADKIVFIGDYFDSRDNISTIEQIHNFKSIVALKEANPNQIVLLFGNHDFHYLHGAGEKYSGYQSWAKYDISEVLQGAINKDLIQMVYLYEIFLFSHAGFTKTWCKNNLGQESPDKERLIGQVNDMLKWRPQYLRFTAGENYDNYGNDITQSPIWVRPESLGKDMIEGYLQIVGHTTQDRLEVTQHVTLIDTLGTSGEYLQILDVNNHCEMIAKTL